MHVQQTQDLNADPDMRLPAGTYDGVLMCKLVLSISSRVFEGPPVFVCRLLALVHAKLAHSASG